MKKRMSKKADTVILETTIFIILNLAFIIMMIIFAYRPSTGDFVYEQAYAKEIALLIDNARPNMTIFVDMGDMKGVLEKHNRKLKDAVSINNDMKSVMISVGREGKTGYSYQFFSDYNISSYVMGIYLVIKVEEKNE